MTPRFPSLFTEGRMPWPLPALATWAASWAVFITATRWLKMSPVLALILAAGIAITFSFRGDTRWRRIFIAWGFPLSLGASGLIGDVPPWAWLLPLALLAVIYPVHAWRDAPLFPTPTDALKGLPKLVPLPDGAHVVDAGCGLGDGLVELRRAYPRAQLSGIEWSWPLRIACAWRTRFANVRQGDIWRTDWSGYDMVYLFQRPESMPRAATKAQRELRPGAWMASLEFPALELVPTKVLDCPDGRRVWLYQAPFKRR
jgi:hypothetical protein